MILIVGLGNPGVRYKFTRHNIGFLVVDALAQHLGVQFSDKNANDDFNSHLAKTQIEKKDVLLVKPQTFMNLSGEAVQALM
ncbi:MAG: aminoacyl-tRNA hydrolase, partial [Bdellovibrionales bacterium]